MLRDICFGTRIAYIGDRRDIPRLEMIPPRRGEMTDFVLHTVLLIAGHRFNDNEAVDFRWLLVSRDRSLPSEQVDGGLSGERLQSKSRGIANLMAGALR